MENRLQKSENYLKTINKLVNNGYLKNALERNTKYINLTTGNLQLLIKHCHLHELSGNFSLAEILFIGICKQFPKKIDPKANLVKFYLRTHQLFKAHQKLELWNEQFSNHKQYIECKIILSDQLWEYDLMFQLVNQYILKYPDEQFGYWKFLRAVSQLRYADFRDQFLMISKKVQNKWFAKRIYTQINNICTKYISSYQLGQKPQFDYKEDSAQILRDMLLFNNHKYYTVLEEIFERTLNIKAIRTLFKVAQLNKISEEKLIQYLKKNKHWCDFHFVKNNLEILNADISINAKHRPLLNSAIKAIDIVYCWCDMDDPAFASKLNRVINLSTKHSDKNHLDTKRYSQIGEIQLSLLSIQKYFPRVNHIYIVTNQQRFDTNFLNTSFRNKIQFVDHIEIMPKQLTDIGVFNSNLIETFIWKINGLSECFLYLNDDVMLGDDLKEGHLFNKSKVPYSTLVPHDFSNYKKIKDMNKINPDKQYYISCLFNAHQQFVEQFKQVPHLGPLHQIMIMTKQSCKELFNIFEPIWRKNFYDDKIRGIHSVYTLMMYNWYALIKGYQITGPHYTYKRRSLYFHTEIYEENVKLIQKMKPLFYCLNYSSDEVSRKLILKLSDNIKQ